MFNGVSWCLVKMCEKSLHVLYSNMFIASTFWQAWQADMDGSNMILAFSMSARANVFNVLWLGDCLEIFPCPAWCLTGIFDDLKVPILKKAYGTYNYLCHPMPIYIFIHLYIYIHIYIYTYIYTYMDASQNAQADPYPEPTGLSIPRSIPKPRWSRPIHTSGSPRADPYPNFDATSYIITSNYKYIYIYTHVFIYIYVYVYICIYIYIYIYIYICTHTCMHAYFWFYTFGMIYIYKYVYIYIYTRNITHFKMISMI